MNRLISLAVALLLPLLSGCEKPSSHSGVIKDPPQQLISVLVADTDATIIFQPDSYHLAMDCVVVPCQDRLFVFFPGSGGSPQDHQRILETMASAGLKGVVLAYENGEAITILCGDDDACYKQSRLDRLFGSSSSTFVSSVVDGIENRLLKALQYLQWNGFYSADVLLYDKIVFAGFSQGAGMAALMGKQKMVDRVCMFAGPWDHTTGPVSASWLSEVSQTPAANFYGFTHMDDEFTDGATFLDLNWQQLGMWAENIEPYTNLTGQKFYTDDVDALCSSDYHACSIRDDVTPLSQGSEPRYAALWRYMCNG